MVYVNGNSLTPKGVVRTGVYSENRVPSACFTQFWMWVGNLCVPGPGEISTNHYKKFYPTTYYEQKNEEFVYIFWEVPTEYLNGENQAIAFFTSFRAPGLDKKMDYLALGALEDSRKKPSIGVWSWDAYSIAPFEYDKLTFDQRRQRAKWDFSGNSFTIDKPGIYYLGDLGLSGNFEVEKSEPNADGIIVYTRKFGLNLLRINNEKSFRRNIIGKGIEGTPVYNKSENWKTLNGYDFTKYQQGISPGGVY